MRFSRRELLSASIPLFAAGCAARRVPRASLAALPRLAPVRVSPDRVVRVTVGLRPYRPSGFVVRTEKLGAKTIVHNYGHGGAGITLSWGTAQLAVNEVANIETRECAVIGCGVVGLSTARLLQLRGYQPTIYTRAMPPSTTSNAAGGLWEPVSLYDNARVTPEFRRQFTEAARFAFRYFQSLAGEEYGVRWLPLFTLSERGPYQAPSEANPASDVEALYPEAMQLTGAQNPFGVPYAHRRHSMLIEPAIYLHALMRDFQIAGGRIVIRDFGGASQILALTEPLIFNCTGLGARVLFDDEELVPLRGQLVFLLPQTEVQYMTIGPGSARGPTYMFPRKDGILLGGSIQKGETNLEPDPAITARILEENRAVFDAMRT